MWFNDPALFFQDMFGYVPYEYQARFMNMFKEPENHKRILALAAAGTGKTNLIAAVALYFTVVIATKENKSKDVIILSGSLDQARNVYGFTQDAIKNNPLLEKYYIKTLRQSDTVFKDGGT